MGTVRYKDFSDNNRGPSALLWNGMPEDIFSDYSVGWIAGDDFMTGGGPSGTITTAINAPLGAGYQVFGGNNATITNAGEVGGALQLFTTDDNVAVGIQSHTGAFQISQSHGKVWFECRYKPTTVLADGGFFLGLCEAVTLSNTVPLTATGALADQNLVGFHKPEANTTAIDTSYKANGVTAVEVNSDVGTLAATTYVKLGMLYDADVKNSAGAPELSFWIDGVKQPSVYNVVSAAGTDFPNDVVLYPTFMLQSASATDKTGTLDWWRCAQLAV